MCMICQPHPALAAHPQYRQLCTAEALEVLIVAGRRARPRKVCDAAVYEHLATVLNSILAETEPTRCFGGRYRHPDPAWSLAMAIRCLVQHQVRLARAHAIVASRTLNAQYSNMEVHRGG